MRIASPIVAALVGCSVLALGAPAVAVTPGLVVWAPPVQAAVISAQLVDGFRGQPVIVVEKDLADIRRDLATVDAQSAPDVIWVDAAWTGQLARDRLVKRLPVSAAMHERFPDNLRATYRYGFDDFGLPVTVSGDALVVNLELVGTEPKTFRQLERQARRLTEGGQASVGLAVGQGGLGAEHLLGPLFTGLGGYLFGENQAGGLDPYNVGLASTALLENAGRIDAWNDAGLISADVSPDRAQRLFAAGEAPFWITGSTSAADVSDLAFAHAVIPVPTIVAGIPAVPLLSVQGAMVTVFADQHGAGDLATALVRRHFADEGVQAELARATLTAPALSGAKVSGLVRDFAAAAAGGVPLPNIPQSAVVLTGFRRAWAQATSGSAAPDAKAAFAAAQRSVVQALG